MIKRYMLASACQFVIGGYTVRNIKPNDPKFHALMGGTVMLMVTSLFEVLKISENTNLHALNHKLHFP